MNLAPAWTSSLLVPLLSALVLLGWARIGWWQWRAPAAQRSRAWRIVVLCVLQALAAVALYRALSPPQQGGATQVMTVLTAGADERANTGISDDDSIVVALPESPATAGTVIRAPDLATALRQHPQVTRLQVRGAGLVERDRDAAAGLALAFEAPPLPVGVVRLDAPANVVAGATWRLSGQVHGVDGGKVEWIDPAGRRTDLADLDTQGRFSLAAVAFASGPADYLLRVRDASGAIVQDVTLPLWVEAPALPRVLLLSGPPNPELRALRRWLGDAGLPVHAQLALGGGMQLGDTALPMTPAQLAKFDLLLIDARAWEGLGDGARAQVMAAVRQGLGLLVRVDQPLSGTALRTLRTPRFVPSAGQSLARLVLPAPRVDDEAAARARRGVGTPDAPFDATIAAEPVPVLARRALQVGGADAIGFGRDADGAPWGWWRAEGLGRVALWTLLDSWRLPLAGRPDLHADLWNEAVSVVARASAGASLRVAADPETGTRTSICGIDAPMQVIAPDASRTRLVVDPASAGDACAGYWPVQAGWHRVEALEPAQGTASAHAFHVRAALPMPSWRVVALGEATRALVQDQVPHSVPLRPAAASSVSPQASGRAPSWPWLSGWWLAMALLWWFERSRWGRRRPQPTAAAH